MRGKKSNYKSILANITFLIKHIWKWHKKSFFYFGICTRVTSILPFIDILMPKFLIDELTGDKRITILIIIILSFLIISSIFNYLTAHLEGFFSPMLIDLGMKFDNLISEKCMQMDFKYTEDPEILNRIDAAERSTSNFTVIFRKLWGLLGMFIAFFGYMAIVATLSPWILLYLIINVLIIYYLTIKAKKYEYSKKDNISEVNRKGKYLYDTMYNFSYGKDIRIFNMSEWIADKFIGVKREEIKIQKGIKKEYLKIDLVDALLIFLREGIVYCYLIYEVLYGNLGIGSFLMYFTTIAGFASWMQKILEDLAYLNGQNQYINDFREFLSSDLESINYNEDKFMNESTYEIE